MLALAGILPFWVRINAIKKDDLIPKGEARNLQDLAEFLAGLTCHVIFRSADQSSELEQIVFFNCPDWYWHSPESGDLWCKAMQRNK